MAEIYNTMSNTEEVGQEQLFNISLEIIRRQCNWKAELKPVREIPVYTVITGSNHKEEKANA